MIPTHKTAQARPDRVIEPHRVQFAADLLFHDQVHERYMRCGNRTPASRLPGPKPGSARGRCPCLSVVSPTRGPTDCPSRSRGTSADRPGQGILRVRGGSGEATIPVAKFGAYLLGPGARTTEGLRSLCS